MIALVLVAKIKGKIIQNNFNRKRREMGLSKIWKAKMLRI
jgi:hypothetical protein